MTFADPLWPLVESWAGRDDVAGIAVGVVREERRARRVDADDAVGGAG